VIEHFLGLAKKLSEIPGLSSKNREIVILVVGAKYQAGYELYAHKVLALKHGVSQAEIDSVLRTECPETFNDEEKAVYDASSDLLNKPGPLSEEKWTRLVAAISKDGATAAIQYVAFYSYIATILNGFDAKIPGAEPESN
jgi:4-carboxymuconolactone decarboxylase